MRALLLLPLLALSAPAAAQGRCPAVASAAEAPAALGSFSLLFRQDGVLFHGRVEGDSTSGGGRLVIQNRNPYPVEVSYDVVLEGAQGERSAFPERCARVGAGEFAPDAGDNAVFPHGAGPVARIRLSNLRITRLAGGAVESATAPAAAPAEGAAGPRAAADPAQYRCTEGGGSAAARDACSAAFMAAAARAAARAGTFTGVTRECLLEYAESQENAARLIRAGNPAGSSLRAMVPACYSRGSAKWGYEALAAACPDGRWTAANRGEVRCAAAPALAAAPRAPGGDTALAGVVAGSPQGADAARERSEAGRALLARGEAAGAEAEFRRAVAIAPATPVYHAQLGEALLRQGRRREAEAAFRAAVWLEPANTGFRRMLARVGEAEREEQAAPPEDAVLADAGEEPRGARVVQTVLRVVFGALMWGATVLLLLPGLWSVSQLLARTGRQLLGRAA